MRLLDEVIDEWRADAPDDARPLAAALRDLLDGPRGTLEGLSVQFGDAGLGDVMRSWMGRGAMADIEPEALGRVLGRERVGALATVAGMAEERFLAALARSLPGVIRRVTDTDPLDV